MYCGELCLKVSEKEDKHVLTLYTRKRKGYILPENEEVFVGDRIEITSDDRDVIISTLLDIAVLLRQGNMKKYRSEKNGTIWTLNRKAHFVVLTGPFTFEFISEGDSFSIDVTAYIEDSMDPRKLGKLTATNTGNTSLYQKCVAALAQFDVTSADVLAYCQSMTETY